jgi:thiol-disulfide isomerase/thioredoxin
MIHLKPSLPSVDVVVVVVVAAVVVAATALCSHSVSGLSDVVVAAYPSSSPSPAMLAHNRRFRPHSASSAHGSRSGSSLTALYYKYLPDDEDEISSDEILDVDGITSSSSTSSNRQTIGVRNTAIKTTSRSSISTTATRAISSRISPIIELHSIQDYHNHIHRNNIDNNHPTMTTTTTTNTSSPLCIIRFSAPWCKVCRSTDVAWERMASKFTNPAAVESTSSSASSSSTKKQIKFFNVNLNNNHNGDGNEGDSTSSSGTSALKDMLHIDRVPQGIIHHPAFGIYEQKVNLHRSNLSILKKRLERYMLLEEDDDDDISGLLMDGEEEGLFWNV